MVAAKKADHIGPFKQMFLADARWSFDVFPMNTIKQHTGLQPHY
jgi:hypothetical protein